MRWQVFSCLTGHKTHGRRWVTREQYLRFFCMCYRLLMPDSSLSEAAQRVALEVRMHLRARARCCLRLARVCFVLPRARFLWHVP